MTLIEQIIEAIHAEAKVWDDEAPFSGEPDYYYGRSQGLNQAINIIREKEKGAEAPLVSPPLDQHSSTPCGCTGDALSGLIPCDQHMEGEA